jgi:2,3-bisphosphoglycerate-dependent phosphoglycerate mutase
MKKGSGWRIVSILLLCMIFPLIYCCWWYWPSPTVVFVVRHAEKATSGTCDPDLADNVPLSTPADVPEGTPAGTTRATELAHVMEDVGLQAVYASKFCRTQQTVKPSADQVPLEVIDVDQTGSANVDALVLRILRDNAGQKVLVAGHQGSVPGLIAGLGGGTVGPILDPEFDNLYVVTIHRRWWWWPSRPRTTVLRLKYGAPT